MLQVRPASLSDGRHVKAVARLDECDLVFSKRVAFRSALNVLGLSVTTLLRGADYRREYGLQESFGHKFWWLGRGVTRAMPRLGYLALSFTMSSQFWLALAALPSK